MHELDRSEMSDRGARGGGARVAGVLILVVAAVVYATGWLDSIASLLVLALGVVVGIALLYLGVTQKRDAEGADGGDDADKW